MKHAPSIDTAPSTGGAFSSAGLNTDENNRISTMKELRTMIKLKHPKQQSVFSRLNADGKKYAGRGREGNEVIRASDGSMFHTASGGHTHALHRAAGLKKTSAKSKQYLARRKKMYNELLKELAAEESEKRRGSAKGVNGVGQRIKTHVNGFAVGERERNNGQRKSQRSNQEVEEFDLLFAKADPRTRTKVQSLHHAPYTLYHAPYTMHPTPCTTHPTPYTMHPTPCTPHIMHHTPHTPCTMHPTPHTAR
jgi:hypothetical protein